jgi:hypothetical protein
MNLMNNERFHIHIDAEKMDNLFVSQLVGERGFSEKNFIRNGERGSQYSPAIHITAKYDDRDTFDRDFDYILDRINGGTKIIGYIEGEFIAIDRRFETRALNHDPRPPFQLELTPLVKGAFRQTELHLTISAEESDQRVVNMLHDMGFFCAYVPKDYGRAQVFTVQGSYRDIARITQPVIDLVERGGLARARLKEERIVRSWVSADARALPPVVGTIHFFNAEAVTMTSDPQVGIKRDLNLSRANA